MSYLAHLHLGNPQPVQLFDSLYGDFVKGRPQRQWSDEIERAIQPHRRIDASTGNHPLMHTTKRRPLLERRRLADVLLGMLFNHCLARDWNDYADESLPQPIEWVYGTLRTASPLSEHPTRVASWMAARDRLGNYHELAVLREVLGDMPRRLSRPHPLDGSWEELVQRYNDLSAGLCTFYPQFQAFALSQR